MLHSSNNRHDVDEAYPRHAVPNDSATDQGLLVAALAPSWFTPAMDRPAAVTYGCYDPPPTTPATYQSTACLAPSTAMYHATTAGVGDLHYYQNDVIATPPYFVADRRLPPEVLDGGVYGGMSMHYRDAVPAGDAWMTTTSSLTPPPSMFAWRNTQVGCSSDLEPVRNFQPYYGSVVVDQPSCRSPVGADSEFVVYSVSQRGKNSVNILPMERLAVKITSSLHESNFACYDCINGITSTADEYNFTSYNCISNITICGRTVEEDYPTRYYCPSSDASVNRLL